MFARGRSFLLSAPPHVFRGEETHDFRSTETTCVGGEKIEEDEEVIVCEISRREREGSEVRGQEMANNLFFKNCS